MSRNPPTTVLSREQFSAMVRVVEARHGRAGALDLVRAQLAAANAVGPPSTLAEIGIPSAEERIADFAEAIRGDYGTMSGTNYYPDLLELIHKHLGVDL